MQMNKPMAMEAGQRFTIRDGASTIGTGVITKLLSNLTDVQKQVMALNKEKKEKWAAGLLDDKMKPIPKHNPNQKVKAKA